MKSVDSNVTVVEILRNAGVRVYRSIVDFKGVGFKNVILISCGITFGLFR